MNQDLAPATGVAQIGIVVADAEATADRYRALFGIDNWRVNYVDSTKGLGSFSADGNQIDLRAKIVWADIGGVEIELIEPREETGLFADFLASRGPGVHHVMLRSASYGQGRDYLVSHGIPLLLEGHQPETRFCLFDSAEALGTIIELAEEAELATDEAL